ncbi:hypothetical protein [Pseudoalteromonas holothuriae]|uniref:hypothetical protein n=1 Tax=Pseudoalteromonas holothuriae TaxID=2963714 RepID=UPI0021C13546|nr:hypothetical protein [Pseudoalteromonas sp. CIP111951]
MSEIPAQSKPLPVLNLNHLSFPPSLILRTREIEQPAFVPVKTEQQQAVLVLHRMLERILSARTACINQTRSLLLEFGIDTPKSYCKFKQELQELLTHSLQPAMLLMISEVYNELTGFERKTHLLDSLFKQENSRSEAAQII